MHLIEADIINNIKNVYDPDVGVNIYDLGLIYSISIDNANMVDIIMTLTSPFCPSGDDLVDAVRDAALLAGAVHAVVNVTFQPPWGPEYISDEGKLELGIF
jgi:metal-sulfur cluster biosynthetic enzyme